ncbi:MAG: ABC transporter ATP-binding protein, partial [Tuberibacillus sp.]
MIEQIKKPFQYKRIPVSETESVTVTKKAPKPKFDTIKRIWKYLAESKKLLFVVMFLVVCSSVLGLLGPFLIGRTVDNYIVARKLSGLPLVLLQLGIVYVLYSAFQWSQNILMIGIAQKTVFKMRTQLFAHLQKLSIPFFDKRQHGELMSRVTNDIDNVSSTLNDSVIQIFSSVIMLTGTIAVMIWLSPILTMATLLIVPLMYMGMRWITNRTGRFFKEQQRRLGDINGYIEEIVSGQRIVKMFSQEERVIEEFTDKSARLRDAGFWAQCVSGFIPKLMNGLNNLGFTLVAAVGGVLALHHMISIGVIVTFAEYTRQFTRPLNDLSNQFNTLLSAVAGAERVFEILDEDVETADETAASTLPAIKGDVEFRNVSFSYEEESKTLKDVSFKVKPGETVALVGPTGAGKTTIINLLSRFYDVNHGAIFIDGVNIATVKRASLREKMGFVLQDSYLFQGTVMENIRYGRLDASDDEVIEAAKMANAYSFIMNLPEQFNTLLTQDGGGISQGQRQLLSIARAVLAKPSILILDEATSSIDTVTEIKIQEALERLMAGRTSFVIAHRLNTIQRADQILVISDGKIIEQGSHAELLEKKGA